MACALPSKPPRRLHSPEEAPQEESLLLQTRIVRVQVRTRPIRDGLDAVLRGLLTYYSQRLECKINLTVLIGNFQKDLMAAYLCRLLPRCPNSGGFRSVPEAQQRLSCPNFYFC